MSQPVELIVFDIAGTTVRDNGEIAAAFKQALQEYGYEVPVEKITPLMGYKKTEAIKKMLNEYEPDTSKIGDSYIDEIHSRFQALMTQYYSETTDLSPLPHAEEVFGVLKERGIKIGLDTGFPKEITAVIIDRLGWMRDGKVDVVISSNEVPAGRPHPYMIQHIMQQTGVTDVRKVIKIGDTEVDVMEGKNAGCLYSIGITTGAFTKEALAPYEPSFIIDDLQELISAIDNNQ